MMKLLFLLCALLLMSPSLFYPAMAYPPPSRFTPPPPSGPGFCEGKCKTRCSRAGVLDRCIRYCGICCQQCKCVPSGTYGNKHECPCYRDLRNSKGKPKCP